MHRWIFSLALLLTLGSFLPAPSTARATFLSPTLTDALKSSSTDSTVPVVVFLENESTQNSVSLISRSEMLSRSQRIIEVSRRLKESRGSNESSIENFLHQHGVSKIRRHWIVAAYSATLPLSAISELSELDGVKEIIVDVAIEGIAPVEVRATASSSAAIAAPLYQLNVPELWRLGLNGKGRLICSFDTGVDEPHPALAPKWRGNHAPLRASWYSPVNPDTVPYDKSGHGTHTMGIMVGSVDADSFGVAPAAEWISAGVIDQGRSLAVTIGDILGAFEWAMDPDGNPSTTDDVPDVINNSWGIPKGVLPPCDATFFQAIDNVEAAGIVTIFAAGNEGPNAMTIRNPGDRATSPINSMAVGAVDANSVIASFSGRGPSSCDTTKIKPDVVAPGVSIRSSARGGLYAIMSGTSMAAPYITGLVALCRQYNPDATVAQIKYALLQATVDLGPAGDDNAYGNGLVDASRLLAYLPTPTQGEFAVSAVTYDGAGYALPGQSTAFHLALRNTGVLSAVRGTIEAAYPANATVEQAVSSFSFENSLSVSDAAFRLTFAADLPHGHQEPFTLRIEAMDGTPLDSITFLMTAGLAPNGKLEAHNAGDITFTISDFGQYGFAAGSIYDLAEQGFRYKNSANLLYESGLLISQGSELASNSVRDSLGNLRRSDFAPIEPLSSAVDESMGGIHKFARFADAQSADPAGLVISQQSVDYTRAQDQGIVMIQYYLINTSNQIMSDISFGFLADFDLSSNGDSVGYDPSTNLFYQAGEGAPYVGIVGLENVASFKTITNGFAKTGLSRATLAEMIASPVNSVSSTTERADVGVLVSTGPLTLPAGDSAAVTLAIVAADEATGLFTRAARARTIFTTSGVSDLPDSYMLSQNYPNPFNPQTTIQFALPSAGDIQLEVYNILGQQVKTIAEGYHAAGTYTVIWDGTDDRNNAVASGVYFYRLMASGATESRKMVLLH